MKVYVAMHNEWESNTILGMFATCEMADEKIAAARARYDVLRPQKLDGTVDDHEWWRVCEWMHAEIIEWDVQG